MKIKPLNENKIGNELQVKYANSEEYITVDCLELINRIKALEEEGYIVDGIIDLALDPQRIIINKHKEGEKETHEMRVIDFNLIQLLDFERYLSRNVVMFEWGLKYG